ncbi:MAG: DUF3095 domain-containing protein [Bacteroidota bacterium]
MSTTQSFYKDLPTSARFEEVLQPSAHRALPEDWWVAITDVVNSTQAIEEGRYKDVNTAGALAAMAIANADKSMDFPFIFGGDGITCLVPGTSKELVADVLCDVKEKVQSYFDLILRVGMVPVAMLYQSGYPLKLSKHQLSPLYQQAVISGPGLAHAERLIKEATAESPYLLQGKKQVEREADFTGFTCRWKDIPSHRGETVATIIQFPGREPDADHQTLLEVLQLIDDLFGREEEYHPVQPEQMELVQTRNDMQREVTALAGKEQSWAFNWKMWQIQMEAFLGRLLMATNLPIPFLKEMKTQLVLSTDYKKYDGSLKLVVSLDSDKRKSWKDALDKLHRQGKLFYGMHISDRAIMTCLLHEGSNKEVHFIDGADGGYALAAKELKRQIEKAKVP